jgi:PAS domain S-box-containing protein
LSSHASNHLIAVSNSINDRFFKLLVSNVEDYAIFMIDPNGYVLSWNPGAEKMHGYREKEIITKHIAIFCPDEAIKKGEPYNNLKAALKNGKHQNTSYRLKKDGSVFWADESLTTVYDDEGRLIGFAEVIKDISDQKRTDDKNEETRAKLEKNARDNTRKLFSSEIKFRQLVENSYDGIVIFNHNLDVIFRSLSTQHIDGWTDKDIASRDKFDFIHPEDLAKLKQVFDEVLLYPGIPIKLIYRTRHKRGYYIWTESIFTNWLQNVNINAIVCNLRDITDQVNANEEIRKKSEQIQDILESITEGFIALDSNFCYIYANKSIGQILGTPPQALIGKCLLDLYPDVLNTPTHRAYKEALEQQRYVRAEDFYAPLNLWYENHIYPSPTGLSVFIRDITLRKKHEEMQVESNALLQEAADTQTAILNALPPNIAVLNKKGKIVSVNQSWKRSTLINNLGLPNYGIGYTYIALCDKAMGIDNADISKISKGINEVISGKRQVYTLEYPWNVDGGKRWYQLMAAPLLDNKHKGAVVQHINITDRKLAEESLTQSEANLRSIFENTDFAIVLFDLDLKIMSFNTNAKNLSLTNYKKPLKKGHSAFSYFPKSRKPFVKAIAEKVLHKEFVNYETTFQLQDGATEWYDVSWIGVVNKSGENMGFILTLKDITAKKMANTEREKITADLAKRNADLEQFTYIISHNLRAPLANIKGLSSMLDSETIKDGEGDEILGALSSSITNLDNVILDLNQILQANGTSNEEFAPVEFEPLVDSITQSIDQLVKKENVKVELKLQVPSLLSIKTYLHSIFYNLIINSIKYHRHNVAPVITISSSVREDKVVVIFKDNGKGIDLSKHNEKLFGLYKRFDFSVEGKGMGLFMVKMQVEKLGGSITVESEVGSWTKFRLEFPLLQQ